MFRSFRARITGTVILLVGATAVLLAVVSFALVERSFRDQLIETALSQTDFNVAVLATSSVLAEDADADDLAASGLTDRFLQRGPDGVYVEFPDSDETFATDFSLLDAGDVIAPELRQLVADGRFGWEFVELDGEQFLVTAARRPSTGPDFYFFYSRTDDEAALAGLRTVLIGSVLGVIALGALIARGVSRSVATPVRTAGIAARRMADGDLDVRLRAGSRDELGQLAESFNEMAGALQQQLQALEQARLREQRFVADVSHELRTPLTGLVGAAGLLRDRTAQVGGQTERLGQLVADDVDRLNSLVADLLEISALEAGPSDAELNTIDLDSFLEAMARDRLPSARVMSNVGPVEVGRRSLERILGNLLDNAARHAPDADVMVGARRDVDELVITVADLGPGVPADALAHLFDRFYSPDPARQGGTGLGLAIAREHAKRMGGALTVRANEPSGLVFQLRAPVTDSLHAGEGAATPVSDPVNDAGQGVQP